MKKSLGQQSTQELFHFRIHGGLDPDEYKSYKESFDAFDWNNNGKISYTSLQVIFNDNDDLLHYSVTLYVFNNKNEK